jgi:hypothetical protein
MDTIMLIQVTDPKAVGLLHDLEELHLIKVLEEKKAPLKTKLSDKYRGTFSKEDAESFNAHTRQMREEWDSTY